MGGKSWQTQTTISDDQKDGGGGGRRGSKGDNGAGRRLDLGWETHNTIYR